MAFTAHFFAARTAARTDCSGRRGKADVDENPADYLSRDRGINDLVQWLCLFTLLSEISYDSSFILLSRLLNRGSERKLLSSGSTLR